MRKNKQYIVTVELSHESFGGHDHKDGNAYYEVVAMNEASASKKALKENSGGYEKRVKSVRLKETY